MITEKTFVRNDRQGFDKAFEIVESFAADNKFSRKQTMHLRLLTEEMLGMVQTIAGEFTADFYLQKEGDEVSIHLEAETEMNSDKRRELIAASSSKKNSAVKGIMGKIRELIEVGLEDYNEVGKLQVQYGVNPVSYGMMGMDNETMSQAMLTWSLNQYKDSLSDADAGSDKDSYQEAWDELEKSIVANIADDIKVGIRQDKLEMVITKKFEQG